MSQKRILIIEDELELAIMIKKYLVKEHYMVEIVTNGKEAFPSFQCFQPDIILLDIMLPSRDGLEILREIRSISIIPVIIISAKETEFDRVLGLKIGADDYMIKPFSIKELVARVEALIRRIDMYQFKQDEKKRLMFHNIIVDLSSRQVFIEGVEVNLTAKEFNVLTFLLNHPKQVITKEQIYDNVWGLNEYGDMNTVTIHIQKIREKLGNMHNITTVRGVGYRFDGELK